VVTGRAYRAERRVAVAAFERGNCLETRARRMRRGRPRSGRRGRVRIECAATRGADAFDFVEVARWVYFLELGSRRGAGLEVAYGIVARVTETRQHGPDPLRTLRMPASGIVLRETRIGGHQQHEHRVSTRPRRYGCSR